MTPEPKQAIETRAIRLTATALLPAPARSPVAARKAVTVVVPMEHAVPKMDTGRQFHSSAYRSATNYIPVVRGQISVVMGANLRGETVPTTTAMRYLPRAVPQTTRRQLHGLE